MGLDVWDSCRTRERAAATVAADLEESKRLGLRGTPAFLVGVIVADEAIKVTRRLYGALPFTAFESAVTEVILATGQEWLLAVPLFYGCPEGCTCTVDPNAWNNIGISCPDAAPADVCAIVYEACYDYCYIDLPAYLWQNHQQLATCELGALGGCAPLGLEPPASITCSCFCWIS